MEINKKLFEHNKSVICEATGLGWYFIYKRDKVNEILEFNGTITTRDFLYAFTTKEECLNKIKELNLKYAPLEDAKKDVDDYINF